MKVEFERIDDGFFLPFPSIYIDFNDKVIGIGWLFWSIYLRGK